jgi:hypothetical protein
MKSNVCSFCGDEFSNKPFTDYEFNSDGKYCSQKCLSEHYKESQALQEETLQGSHESYENSEEN